MSYDKQLLNALSLTLCSAGLDLSTQCRILPLHCTMPADAMFLGEVDMYGYPFGYAHMVYRVKPHRAAALWVLVCQVRNPLYFGD
jgi:hypothetical protein